MVELLYKPDFEEARQRLEALWHHEIIDRPCLTITAPKDNVVAGIPGRLLYLTGWDGDYEEAVRLYEENVARTTWFAAEALPVLDVSFGPDQFAAYLGSDLERSELIPDERPTSWAKPIVERWEDILPLRLEPENPWWKKTLEFLRVAREGARGKFLINTFDLHSNMDALLALRGGENLCLDLMDQPELIDQAMRDVRQLYEPIYDGIYEAAGMAETGTTGWLPFYSRGKFSTIQCDFIAMISPRQFDRFVKEALIEESEFLDRCAFHWDGPTALPHFDALASIPRIDAIQWMPGAAEKPHVAWIDLLKRIQQAGKIAWVQGTPDEIKVIHKELDPTLVLYDTACASEKEAESLITWFQNHT